MGYIVRMPKLGMEMESGTLIAWHVDTGEEVSEDQPLAEIESEKTTAEITAREDGVLRHIFVEEGETTKPGNPVGIVAAVDEDISDLEAEVEEADQQNATPVVTDGTNSQSVTTPIEADEVHATPKAKKRAAELDVDLSGITGSGYQGAVTAEDVEEASRASSARPERTVSSRRSFDGIRQTIADRLGESHRRAVHVTLDRDVSADVLLDTLDRARESIDGDVTITDLLLRAVSATLTNHPEFNATVEDDVHYLYDEQNIGVAVDTDDGLLVPVIPDVDTLSLQDLVSTRTKMTNAVTSGDFTNDIFQNGTFTISNLGPYNVDSFTPIINPPQVAILGINRIKARDAHKRSEESEHSMRFSLSFDHRAVDGADAARFLETLAEYVQETDVLLPDDTIHRNNGREQVSAVQRRTVTASTSGGMDGEVHCGEYSWRVDEPKDLGGDGTASSPVDRFLGSLAACLAVSIGFQAQKRDVSLSSITIDLEARPKQGTIERLEATVEIQGAPDEETIDRLISMGERGCTVSNLISDEIEFVINQR